MAEKKAAATDTPYGSTGEPARRAQRRAKVLVPVDFSEASRKALEFALRYAENEPSELYLFHVFEPVSRLRFVGKKLADKLDAELERMEGMAMGELERMVSDSDKKEHIRNFHRRVASGKPSEEILRMAANINADIIVMGTYGRDVADRAVVGSTTEKVVRRAPCTVVCVRDKDPYFVMP